MLLAGSTGWRCAGKQGPCAPPWIHSAVEQRGAQMGTGAVHFLKNMWGDCCQAAGTACLRRAQVRQCLVVKADGRRPAEGYAAVCVSSLHGPSAARLPAASS